MNLNGNLKIIIGIVILAVLIVAGFLIYGKYFSRPVLSPEIVSKDDKSGISTSTPEIANSQISALIPGFRLYKNTYFGFEIQYPESWAISEENIVNVRGENTEAFYFKKPGSDLRFAILPRDGLSYGLPDSGTSNQVLIGGSAGIQQKWTLSDGRRLWLLNPQYGLNHWLEDIGRIDILSSATDPASDTITFEKMLNSFKLSK